jgi:hypothetical protein
MTLGKRQTSYLLQPPKLNVNRILKWLNIMISACQKSESSGGDGIDSYEAAAFTSNMSRESRANFIQRQDNPLKKMQSLIGLCNKLIRVLFGIMKKGHEFNEDKMMQDIPRFAMLPQVA